MPLLKRIFKLALCLACCCLYGVFCIAVSVVSVVLLPRRQRCGIAFVSQIFARALVKIIGIRVEVSGEKYPPSSNGTGCLIVSNHLSYVDGFILGSLFPVIYVSKIELSKWPLIGFMCQAAGTLFIDREKKNRIAAAVATMAETLKNGANVLVFPEGTSTNGEALLSFQSAFFEAAAAARVVPVAVVYQSIDGEVVTAENRDKIYWYGEMTFADHFFRLLGLDSVKARVHVCLPVLAGEGDGRAGARKRLSDISYRLISDGIHLIKPTAGAR